MTIRKTKKKTIEKQGSLQEPNWVEEMNQAIDNLSENRTSIREEALQTMMKSFSNHLVSSHIENRLDMLLSLLKRSITKYGSSKEACLAVQTVNLVFMQLTEDVSETDQDDLYLRIFPCLKSAVKESDDIEIKIKCLKTLGLITYTSASDTDKQLVRDYIFDLIEMDGIEFNMEALQSHDCDRFLAEALSCYGILFAASFSQGVVSFDAVWNEVEKVMPIHEIMLESSDNNVRIASGENIGLIFETIRLFTKEDDGDDTTTTKPEYDNMDGLIHTLKNLSIESNRYKNKSERMEQKSVFREILKSVEQNERPKEDLKIGNRTLVFKGWAKILVLNAFRKSLGQGLQFHLKSNSLVKDIFRYSFVHNDDDNSEEDDIMTLSNVDKHYVYDENKKARSKYLRSARLGKENQIFKVA